MTKTNPDPVLLNSAMLARRSVVSILALKKKEGKTSLGTGSGFVIRSVGTKCIVLTCDHVVEDSYQIYVRRMRETGIEQLPGDLMYRRLNKFNKFVDIAIIKVDLLAEEVPVLSFASAANMVVGDDTIALGYCNPDDLFGPPLAFMKTPCVSPGSVKLPRIENVGRMNQVSKDCLCVGCVGMKGMSGGPLVCRRGVVGVIDSGEYGTTYAICTETVHQVLKKWLGINDTRSIQEVIQAIPI